MLNEINLKSITTAVAVFGLVFTVYKFFKIQEIEAAKPYLERKLAWCEEAVETASKIANSGTDSYEDLEKRFDEMYWGVMGLVERNEIARAMINFRTAINEKADLKKASLDISHACRKELATDWSSSWAR